MNSLVTTKLNLVNPIAKNNKQVNNKICLQKNIIELQQTGKINKNIQCLLTDRTLRTFLNILFDIHEINFLQVSIRIFWMGWEAINTVHCLSKSKDLTSRQIANCLDRSLCFWHNALKQQKSDDGRGKSNKKTSESNARKKRTFFVFEADYRTQIYLK